MWKKLTFVLLVSTCCLIVAQETVTQGNRPDYCSLPPVETGEKKCKGYIRKFTFNATEESCVSYIYGGCNGTKNLFDTEEECKTSCPSSLVSVKKQKDATTVSSSGPSIHPHQYLLAVINCLYSFFFLLTRYF